MYRQSQLLAHSRGRNRRHSLRVSFMCGRLAVVAVVVPGGARLPQRIVAVAVVVALGLETTRFIRHGRLAQRKLDRLASAARVPLQSPPIRPTVVTATTAVIPVSAPQRIFRTLTVSEVE